MADQLDTVTYVGVILQHHQLPQYSVDEGTKRPRVLFRVE